MSYPHQHHLTRLTDIHNYQTRQPFVYDLQEPFRWHSDLSVIEVFESEALELSDFYFKEDDYRYRFEPEARQRFTDLRTKASNEQYFRLYDETRQKLLA
jgi:hypothetical protein